MMYNYVKKEKNMALVECPHCGKSVSEYAKVCVHCGKELSADFAKHEEKETEEKETNYETLSPSIQRELKREFNSEYPQYAKYEDREPFYKKLKIISWIVLALCVVSAYIMYKQKNIPMIVVTVILLFISYGYDIYYPIAIRNNKKKQLRILKLYVKWLKDKKSIIYNVKFSKSDAGFKKYYDAINVDFEKI